MSTCIKSRMSNMDALCLALDGPTNSMQVCHTCSFGILFKYLEILPCISYISLYTYVYILLKTILYKISYSKTPAQLSKSFRFPSTWQVNSRHVYYVHVCFYIVYILIFLIRKFARAVSSIRLECYSNNN